MSVPQTISEYWQHQGISPGNYILIIEGFIPMVHYATIADVRSKDIPL